MSSTPDGEGGSGGPLSGISVGVALLVMVAALIAVAIGLNRVAGRNTAAGVNTPNPSPTAPTTPTPLPTPSLTPTPVPTPTAAPIAFADCNKAAFVVTPLAPLNPPADVHKYSAVPPMTINTAKLYQMTIKTAKGNIVLCLQPQLAPTTVNVMVTLARNHFFDGLTFHRVVPDFVIQGGDPAGTGSGGPGFSFADEPVRNSYVVGAVAMANSGPNTNGSQFFVCIGSQCPPLPPKYNLFGKVESGQDVAGKIAQGDAMESVTVRVQQ